MLSWQATHLPTRIGLTCREKSTVPCIAARISRAGKTLRPGSSVSDSLGFGAAHPTASNIGIKARKDVEKWWPRDFSAIGVVRSEKSGAGGFIVAVMHEADRPVEACLKEALAGVSTEARTVSGYLSGVGVTDLVMSFIWMLVTAANFSEAVCGRVYLSGFRLG